MLPDQLSPEQEALIQAPLGEGETYFLSGSAGAGKSTVLAARLAHLLDRGIPAYSILVLLPDRAARERLRQTLQGIPRGPHGDVSLHTYYSLAQRMVALFWPLVARPAGFAHPERPPVFLTYELAQHHLRRIIEPLLEQGYFEGLHLHPQRLVSQLLDNLNKAALNGYPIEQIVLRLSATWGGPPERLLAFQQVQECIVRFRHTCLERGLLDLSLVLLCFQHYLLDTPPFWAYFRERYRHLMVDNLEENVPIAHDFVARLLPHCDSALLVYDEGGGYRTLLGADPEGAVSLQRACRQQRRLPGPLAPTEHLATAVAARLGQMPGGVEGAEQAIRAVLQTRYRSEMIAQVALALDDLVHREQVPPQEIAVVVPYLDGVLRFALGQECAARKVPLRFLRRYRRPVEEPAVRALLTLAVLLHPEWGLVPPRYDVTEALVQILDDLDPVRAALLSDWAYDPAGPAWRPPEGLSPTARRRLGPDLLEVYERFWARWQTILPAADLPWEHLLAHLLGQILPQAVQDPATATACAELVESARRFRQVFPILHAGEDLHMVGRDYLQVLRSGIVTAQYLVREEETPAVLVAPAHSYLVAGRPVQWQFWLDIASADWWTPPQQPLTNPYVLSRHWPAGNTWSDAADYAARQTALARVIQGLCNRCRQGVVLCSSKYSTAGQQQDGPLLRILEPVLRRTLEGGTP